MKLASENSPFYVEGIGCLSSYKTDGQYFVMVLTL